MKIAAAIIKPERISPLSEIFGRSNYFLIYDTVKGSEEILTNPYVNELGGAGIQSAKLLIENNVDAIITKHIGKNPFRFLASVNIKVYQCKNENAVNSIRLLIENKLTSFENIDVNIPAGKKRKRHGKFFN